MRRVHTFRRTRSSAPVRIATHINVKKVSKYYVRLTCFLSEHVQCESHRTGQLTNSMDLSPS
jgi:hypothetical protein